MADTGELDYIHISGVTYESFPHLFPVMCRERSLLARPAALKQQLRNQLIITVDSLHAEAGKKLLQEEKAYLAAIGHAFITDPHLPNRLMDRNLDDTWPCILCNEARMDCLFKVVPVWCSVNAALGRVAPGRWRQRPRSNEEEMQYSRQEVIDRLRKTIAEGRPVIGAGAGTGISAKFAERGGADLIIIYNSGRYRMGGLPSSCGLLPIGDANRIVLEMGEREVLAVVKQAPVIAGVFASDPTREIWYLLKQIKAMGFSGVINFPTVGLLEGALRSDLEGWGLGFQRDVDMIVQARALDLFTMAYVFTPDEATRMATAGVDCVVAHMGNTSGGSVGRVGEGPTLEDAACRTQAIVDAARTLNEAIMSLCHGGPIATPEDVAYILAHTDVEGFVGASSMERLPVEKPLEEATHKFKCLSIKRRK